MREHAYFRRYFDMHWSDRYTAKELAEMDRKNMAEARRSSYQTNIVEIIDALTARVKALEARGGDGAPDAC